MCKLNKITIQGFRRLHDVSIEMQPLMVMIGANGVGKSSFMDALSLLAASADGKCNQTLNDLGGVANICTQGGSEDITFHAEMASPNDAPLEYMLHMETKGHTYNIVQEHLIHHRTGYDQPFIHITSNNKVVHYFNPETRSLVRADWDLAPEESALSQVPKMFREPAEFRQVLRSATKYHVIDVGGRAPVKLPQQMKPDTLPGANGEALVSFLYTLRESDRDRYETIEDTLKSAFPGFEAMRFPPVAAGMLSLTWKERHFNNPLYIHQLSDGMLRFLWLISLLQSPGLSNITMIDEPEVSLHPELLSLLADLLREASRKTQVIVGTHSDRLIRFLEPHEVIILDIDDAGYTNAVRGDALDLKEWLEEYSLDEIWRMGRMGGRS
jgi:predicted ATPase